MGMTGRFRRGAAIGVVVAFTTLAVVVSLGSPAGAAKPLARAVLRNAAGTAIGEVVFKGEGTYADRVEVDLTLPAGFPNPGAYHGLHVHTTGTCTAPTFVSAGGHWNLGSGPHGSHTGDLPSVLVAPDGTAYAEFETHRFDVAGLFDGDGSAVVLHVGPDNFGNVPLGAGKYLDDGGSAGTAATGDAGARYGCGVVQPA